MSFSRSAFAASVGIACLAMGMLLTSCGPDPLADDWIEPRPLAGPERAYHPPRLISDDAAESAGATAPLQAPTGDVTLAEAVAIALLHNPELRTFGWDVRVAEARAVQAGLSPNPRAGVTSENLGGPDNVSVRNTVRLSQVIELGGKRRKRVDLAEANRTLAAWDYEERRIDVVTEVARRHIAVLAAQRRLDLTRQTLRLAEQTLKIVEDRVAAGVVPTSERDKAVVRVSSERIRLDRARRQLASARQSLASAWGGDAAQFGKAVGDFDRVDGLPERNKTLSLAQRNPRVARWRDEIEQRRRAVRLARARGVPDVTAGVGVRHFAESDDAALLVEFSSPIPIVDRNQGGVLEARYNVAKAISEQRAAEVAVRDELVRALEGLAAAHFETVTLRDETLPAARNAFDAARDAFEQGRSDFLDVLDAERTLVDIERQLLDALETYHHGNAAVEGLVAGPVSERE